MVKRAREVRAAIDAAGAHDAYNTGDKVSYNGKRYVCTIDANTYAPGVYGWTEIE